MFIFSLNKNIFINFVAYLTCNETTNSRGSSSSNNNNMIVGSSKPQSKSKKLNSNCNNNNSPKLTREKIRIQRKKPNKEDPNANRYHSGCSLAFKHILFLY